MALDTRSKPEDTSAVAAIPFVTVAIAPHGSVLEISATENGITSPVTATTGSVAVIAALPVKKTLMQSSDQQGKVGQAKSSRSSKPSATTETSSAKAKQTKPSTPTGGKVNQRGKASNLQRFLKSQWRDKALTAEVGAILDRASTTMSTDEVMAALDDICLKRITIVPSIR